MPLFYFNIEDGHSEPDADGVDLPGIKEARDEAINISGEMLRDGLSSKIWDGKPWRLWVTTGANGSGKTLFTLTFAASDGA